MSATPSSDSLSHLEQRAESLYQTRYQQIAARTDRLFAWLMLGQWIASVSGAFFISPRTWDGSNSSIHIHVWSAMIIGFAITAPPVLLTIRRPGQPVTRFVIAGTQMLASALLIDVTGGRLETHFHVFGSLAILAFYRDWRVFIPAVAVVGLDHLIRGIVAPASVYGVLSASPWRSAEHAGWVIFECFFLVQACLQGKAEMLTLARDHTRLESVNELVRTKDLEAQNRLLEAARQAGMAEVASGVLHNVGNTLNSLKVSAEMIGDRVRKSKVSSFAKVTSLLRDHEDDLDNFITHDQQGKQLPAYLMSLANVLKEEQTDITSELESLTRNVHHIEAIVGTQQTYARVSRVDEKIHVATVVDDALQMSSGAFERHGIALVRDFSEMPAVNMDRQKLLLILINLIRNAKHSICERNDADKRLTIRINCTEDRLRIAIIDTGMGVAPENRTRIFSHGFTTKRDGHGFGLHSSALAAAQMGGILSVDSDGLGMGATFALELPLQQTFIKAA